jgi:outer membrane receptor protein involved in Fe transport
VVKTSGFDMSVSYDFAAFGGRMHVALDGAWIDELLKQITETSTPIDMLETFSNPTQWRLRAHAGFRSGGWSANAFVHYRSAYTDNRFLPFVEVDEYITADATVGYSFGETSGALSNLTIALGAINVLDEEPPPTRVRPTTGVFDLGFDPANASPVGRMLTLDLTKRW